MSSANGQIKVILEYQDKQLTITVPPYKKISYLRQRAINYFYPVKTDIELTYKNQSINDKLQWLIGDFFIKKNAILIKCVPVEKRLKKIPKKHAKWALNCDQRDRSGLKVNLCDCGLNYVSHFCRVCKKFICNTCKRSAEHFDHDCFEIDLTNFEESLKLYGALIQNQSISHKEAISKCYSRFQKSNFIDYNTRNEMVIRNLELIQKQCKQIIDNLEMKEDEEKNISSIMEEFNQSSKKIADDIDVILADSYAKSKATENGIDYDTFKSYMLQINAQEQLLDAASVDILAYQVNYEVCYQMDNFYNQLDNLIERMIQSTIPLRLDPDAFELYKKIKHIKENAPHSSNQLATDPTPKEEPFQHPPEEEPQKGEASKPELKKKVHKVVKKVVNNSPLQEQENHSKESESNSKTIEAKKNNSNTQSIEESNKDFYNYNDNKYKRHPADDFPVSVQSGKFDPYANELQSKSKNENEHSRNVSGNQLQLQNQNINIEINNTQGSKSSTSKKNQSQVQKKKKQKPSQSPTVKEEESPKNMKKSLQKNEKKATQEEKQQEAKKAGEGVSANEEGENDDEFDLI